MRQGKTEEKDTAREASEGDWGSLTMFLKKSLISSAETRICLKQLCCLFFFFFFNLTLTNQKYIFWHVLMKQQPSPRWPPPFSH